MTGKDSVKKCEDEVTDEGCLEETTPHKDDTIHGEVKIHRNFGVRGVEIRLKPFFLSYLRTASPPPYFLIKINFTDLQDL